jgi:hypothetical protein
MSFPGFDDPPAWGTPEEPPTSGDIIKDALQKEKVLKWVVDGYCLSAWRFIIFQREIAAAQEDLRGLCILSPISLALSEPPRSVAGSGEDCAGRNWQARVRERYVADVHW